ncbi:PREDICTED: ribonuclease P protein subunit p29 [Wasmannia auropunctata]|uniref:ribonuclease P protein subunit p29 n=1 Tax=Wasmannia auropunctata TaxID=64793 RepID=UPI0005EE497E|nr:PREDICTED: ribonuclease P protein subunit p29 [Wasmannia auropunctata]XP_011698628.1 PREDICTED: ribonuclease P protein subunit p29 [Wasmannia auropunctata]
MSSYAKVCAPLPKSQTSHIKICENTQQYVINFLQNLLPPSDHKAISDELRKTFIFNKIKPKPKQKVKKGKFFSARKRLRFGLGRIGNKNQMRYSDLLPLNQLWLQYMREMLGVESFADIPRDPSSPHWENANLQLMKADFHGAKISIDRSRCPSLVGVMGIVIQDTKNTFRVCGMDNVIRTIPKDVVKINVYLDDGVTLKALGRELSIRPAERAVKKFKNSSVVML